MTIIDIKELDALDEACALRIMKWTVFKRGNIETYEPVGVTVEGFRPTRWVLDSFKLVDALKDVSFSLVRNDDKTFTAVFSDRNTAHRATKPTAPHAITVAALHYATDVMSEQRGPVGPKSGKTR